MEYVVYFHSIQQTDNNGEGGILITNNKKFIEKIKILKALGVNTPPELRKNREYTIQI